MDIYAKHVRDYVSDDAARRLDDVDQHAGHGDQHRLALSHIADLLGESGVAENYGGGVFDGEEHVGVAEWADALIRDALDLPLSEDTPDALVEKVAAALMIATDRGVIVGLGAAHHAVKRDTARMDGLQSRMDALSMDTRKTMLAFDRSPDGSPKHTAARKRLAQLAAKRAELEQVMSMLADRWPTDKTNDDGAGA